MRGDYRRHRSIEHRGEHGPVERAVQWPAVYRGELWPMHRVLNQGVAIVVVASVVVRVPPQVTFVAIEVEHLRVLLGFRRRRSRRRLLQQERNLT